jgi:hypothetical protein
MVRLIVEVTSRLFKKYARHTNIEGSPLEEALLEIGEAFKLAATLKGDGM